VLRGCGCGSLMMACPSPAAGGGRPGSDPANLTARVQAVGGRLAIGRAAGRFDLVAEIPLTPPLR
jgi:hypothetical protein